MNTLSDLEALVFMSTIPGLGPSKIRMLIERFGSASEAIKTSQDTIAALHGFDTIALQWTSWRKNIEWQRELEAATTTGTSIIPFTSPDYPKILLQIADPPTLLYVRGTLFPADTQRSIAIVGTRQASIYGLEMAETIADGLASKGFTIISGLARGIDTAAHRGALKSGRTLAIIGSGLNDVYPPENRNLGKTIAQHGALISEFSMNTPPDRQQFPQRNRIVSGLSGGILLIEAPIKSGAMITMEKGLGHRKKLFALPGRADIETFRGNHLLIKRGNAHLIENVDDILKHYEDLFSLPMQKAGGRAEGTVISSQEKSFLDRLPVEELNIEALVRLTGIPINQLNSLLMGLLLKKKIKQYPGKIFKKV